MSSRTVWPLPSSPHLRRSYVPTLVPPLAVPRLAGVASCTTGPADRGLSFPRGESVFFLLFLFDFCCFCCCFSNVFIFSTPFERFSFFASYSLLFEGLLLFLSRLSFLNIFLNSFSSKVCLKALFKIFLFKSFV